MANWVAGAISHPGSLHRQMGIPTGQTIPAARLAKAASSPGLLGKRARLAETLKGLSKSHPQHLLHHALVKGMKSNDIAEDRNDPNDATREED